MYIVCMLKDMVWLMNHSGRHNLFWVLKWWCRLNCVMEWSLCVLDLWKMICTFMIVEMYVYVNWTTLCYGLLWTACMAGLIWVWMIMHVFGTFDVWQDYTKKMMYDEFYCICMLLAWVCGTAMTVSLIEYISWYAFPCVWNNIVSDADVV